MKKLIVFVAVVYLLARWLDSKPFNQYVDPSQATYQYAQAGYTQAQTAQIYDDIRRQREMDNGLGFNMAARILQCRGLTAAEDLACGVVTVAGIVIGVVSAVGAIALLLLLIKLTTSTVRRE